MSQPLEIVAPIETVDSFDDPVTGEPGGRADCPLCGKNLTVTAKGTLRSHVCQDGRKTGDVSSGQGSGTAASKRKKSAPASVHVITTAVIAGSVEWSAAKTLSRTIPTSFERARAATDMGNNDEALIKPIVNAIWPELPKGAQDALIRIADHSDLIACLFAWSDYFAGLKQFSDAEKARIREMSGGAVSGNQRTSTAGLRFEPVANG